MPPQAARPIEAIRVGEKGRIAVPPRYRKLHNLSKGSEVLLVQLGETLMVVPSDAVSSASMARASRSAVPRVFLDSGVLLEGLLAPWSASRAVLILSRRRVFKIVLANMSKTKSKKSIGTGI
jgi:bifunctional DNA-binding transcriptional regulator/antitoxin component of YhaV-PrlF toxin-antitoxin module